MGNRKAQMHLTSAQVASIRRQLQEAWEVSPAAYDAEVRNLARTWGLRTDTVKELSRVGHKERSR